MRISPIGACSLAAVLALAPLATIAAAAHAADLPGTAAVPLEEEGEAPPPMPVFSWAGPYAGVQAGYAFGRDHAALSAPVTPLPAAAGATTVTQTAARTFFADGIIGGAHVGYNIATGASLDHPVGVFGVEADIDGSNYGRRSSGVVAVPGGTAYAFSPGISDVKSEIGGSIRGRAGVGVKRLLFYGTGGLAVASFSSDIPGAAESRADVTRVGYTLGGGLEYAMTNHMALRAEYRYSDFGRSTDAAAAAVFPGATLSHRDSFSRLQGGISYLFADPVAPRAD